MSGLGRRKGGRAGRRGGRLGGSGGSSGGGGDEWDALLNSALHWYRADTVTLSGANLSTMPNRGTGGGAMTVTLGTLAAPAADAALGGAPSVVFSGAQQLQSNLTASAFTYLHQSHDTFLVYSGSVENTLLFSTASGLGGAGDTGVRCMEFSGQCAYLVTSAGSYTYIGQTPNTAGQPRCLEVALAESGSPPAFGSRGGVAFGPTSLSGTPAAGAPSIPLTFGVLPASLPNPRVRIADFISFNRRLFPYERQLIQDYVRTRYGISLPTMTGADREVLKLNPYSWIRADRYVENAGKVSAFPDLVLPLHAMGQGTAVAQVAVPVADAAFGGQPALNFTGVQWYQSTFPASAWTFTNDGTGVEVSTGLLYTESNSGSGQFPISTSYHASNPGFSLLEYSGAQYFSVNGSPFSAPYGSLGVAGVYSAHADNTTLVLQTPTTTASSGYTPNPAAAPYAMFVGSNSAGPSPMKGKISDVLFFRRVLADAERATLADYYQIRCGI